MVAVDLAFVVAAVVPHIFLASVISTKLLLQMLDGYGTCYLATRFSLRSCFDASCYGVYFSCHRDG